MKILDWLKEAFRFDGIQDNEIPSDSDWQLLTPMERIGIQTQDDADIAKRIIAFRKTLRRHSAEVVKNVTKNNQLLRRLNK